MSARTVLARLPFGPNEVVISRARAGQIDVRLWTDLNGLGVRMASKHGLTLPLELLPQVIEAFQAALGSTGGDMTFHSLVSTKGEDAP